MIDISSTALSVIPPTHFREIAPDDRKVVAVSLLLMFANAYYKQLECAVRVPCSELDMKFNQRYLWVVKNIRHLLLKHPDLADFPLRFHPVFADLNPSTVRDVDWDEFVAPEAEKFISSIQMYAVDHGIHDLEEDSPAWRFLEKFRPGINEAIETGLEYRRRMEIQSLRTRKRAAKSQNARRFRETHDAIRKNTELIPELIEKVDKTPTRTAVLIGGPAKRNRHISSSIVEDGFSASADFSVVHFDGDTFALGKKAAVALLAIYHQMKELGWKKVPQNDIFEEIYGDNRKKWPKNLPRLQSLFRTGDAKRLWDAGFIDHDHDGNFFLTPKIHR